MCGALCILDIFSRMSTVDSSHNRPLRGTKLFYVLPQILVGWEDGQR